MRTATAALCAYCCGIVPVGCAGVADALQCGGDSSVLRHGGNGDVFPAVDAHGDDAAGADILGGRGALPLCLGSACALAGAGGSEDAEMTGRGSPRPLPPIYPISGMRWHHAACCEAPQWCRIIQVAAI